MQIIKRSHNFYYGYNFFTIKSLKILKNVYFVTYLHISLIAFYLIKMIKVLL